MTITLDKTFAVRFANFLKDISVSDAASDDELNYLKTTASRILKQQCLTAIDEDEIKYLKMVGVYDENIKPIFTTHDGVDIFYENDTTKIYSCTTDLTHGPNIQVDEFRRIYLRGINSKRMYFYLETEMHKWIRENKKIYSILDVKEMFEKYSKDNLKSPW